MTATSVSRPRRNQTSLCRPSRSRCRLRTIVSGTSATPGRFGTDRLASCGRACASTLVAGEALDPLREQGIDDHVRLLSGLDLCTRHEIRERLLSAGFAEVEALEDARSIRGSSSGEDGTQRLLFRRAEAAPVGIELGSQLGKSPCVSPIPLCSSGCTTTGNFLPESIRKKHRALRMPFRCIDKRIHSVARRASSSVEAVDDVGADVRCPETTEADWDGLSVKRSVLPLEEHLHETWFRA